MSRKTIVKHIKTHEENDFCGCPILLNSSKEVEEVFTMIEFVRLPSKGYMYLGEIYGRPVFEKAKIITGVK